MNELFYSDWYSYTKINHDLPMWQDKNKRDIEKLNDEIQRKRKLFYNDLNIIVEKINDLLHKTDYIITIHNILNNQADIVGLELFKVFLSNKKIGQDVIMSCSFNFLENNINELSNNLINDLCLNSKSKEFLKMTIIDMYLKRFDFNDFNRMLQRLQRPNKLKKIISKIK